MSSRTCSPAGVFNLTILRPGPPGKRPCSYLLIDAAPAVKNPGRQISVPDEIALLQVAALIFIRRAVNDSELFGPIQCPDLTGFAAGFHLPGKRKYPKADASSP